MRARDASPIDSVATLYPDSLLGPNIRTGVQCEFNIDGNDPPVNPVPVPAAVWLFGSGLVGLVGLAVRRERASRGRKYPAAACSEPVACPLIRTLLRR